MNAVFQSHLSSTFVPRTLVLHPAGSMGCARAMSRPWSGPLKTSLVVEY